MHHRKCVHFALQATNIPMRIIEFLYIWELFHYIILILYFLKYLVFTNFILTKKADILNKNGCADIFISCCGETMYLMNIYFYFLMLFLLTSICKPKLIL